MFSENDNFDYYATKKKMSGYYLGTCKGKFCRTYFELRKKWKPNLICFY